MSWYIWYSPLRLFEVAIESWPEWDLNPQPLILSFWKTYWKVCWERLPKDVVIQQIQKVYIYICVCVCVCVFVYIIHVCIYLRVYIYTHKYIHVYILSEFPVNHYLLATFLNKLFNKFSRITVAVFQYWKYSVNSYSSYIIRIHTYLYIYTQIYMYMYIYI